MNLKISPATNRSTGGHVLAMVLVVVTICAIALSSYLQLVNAQNRAVARSQGWNASVPVMEAGIEEALAHLNKNADSGLSVDGWVRIGNYYRMERSVGDSYYVVTVSITNSLFPIIESRGFCHMPLLVQNNNQSPYFLAAAGVNYGSPRQGYVGRGVRIDARKNGSLIKAMLAKGKINIGGDVLVDSYDSCDPAKSSGGRYDPAKAGDVGDIASNGQLVNDVAAGGSVKIKGHVSTGPGGTAGFTGRASAGSSSFVDGGYTGIEQGWFRDDMNANIPDAPVPPTGGYTGFPPGGYVGGTYYDYILPSGVYVMDPQMDLVSKKVLVSGDVVINVKGDLKMTGTAGITIGTAGNLTLFCSGSTANIAGQGVINQAGDPRRFTYYGTKTNTKLSYSGTSEFIGMIYAPYADLDVAGGSIIHGGMVSKSVQAKGGFTLHYDECLKKEGQGRYIVTSWNEMLPQEVARVP